MKCLVTGGAGFIGSHLVDRLINEEYQVIVVDDESAKENNEFYWNDKAQNYKYDICNYKKIEPLFKNVDFVFHLAAESRIQRAIKDPKRTINVNLYGTINILEASKKYKVKKIIYSSTSAYYGLKNIPPHTESMTRDCLNPYSVTKVAGEDLVKMYSSLYNINSVIFRYFNVYGERQPVKGQYAPVIGLFQKMKSEGKKMTVVGDGLSRRDYTHVSDVVSANMLAIKKKTIKKCIVLNIGTGKNYNVLEVANMIGGAIKHIPPREGEAKETLADISKVQKTFGWFPNVDLKKWINDNS